MCVLKSVSHLAVIIRSTVRRRRSFARFGFLVVGFWFLVFLAFFYAVRLSSSSSSRRCFSHLFNLPPVCGFSFLAYFLLLFLFLLFCTSLICQNLAAAAAAAVFSL